MQSNSFGAAGAGAEVTAPAGIRSGCFPAPRQSVNLNRTIARIAFTPSLHVIFFPSS